LTGIEYLLPSGTMTRCCPALPPFNQDKFWSRFRTAVLV